MSIMFSPQTFVSAVAGGGGLEATAAVEDAVAAVAAATETSDANDGRPLNGN